MHVSGNDFVVLDLRDAEGPTPELCAALADRHRGVGCDLVLGVTAPRSAEAVAGFGIWTAEGTPSQQSANGVCCIAAWAVRAGLARDSRFAIDSPGSTHTVEALASQSFRIDMGAPQFAPERIPLFGFDAEQDLYDAELDDASHLRFRAVSMGSSHAVIEVDDIETAPVARVARLLQSSGLFLPTVNVGFAKVLSRNRIRLRVYEHGPAETLACGSGACAATAVLMRAGRLDRSVSVSLPGGDLQVDWPDPAGPMLVTGTPELTYEGTFLRASSPSIPVGRSRIVPCSRSFPVPRREEG